MNDADREKLIQAYRDEMVEASSPLERMAAWLKLRQEIFNRSPEQVRKMEEAISGGR